MSLDFECLGGWPGVGRQTGSTGPRVHADPYASSGLVAIQPATLTRISRSAEVSVHKATVQKAH